MNLHLRKTLVVAIMALVALAVCGEFQEARAVPITFAFGGGVSDVFNPSMNAAIDETFSRGDILTGSYTFESTTPDTSTDPRFGVYQAITAISYTVGGYSVSATSGNIIVANDIFEPGGDLYQVASGEGPPVGGLTLLSIFLYLATDSSPHNPFDSNALPLSLPGISLGERPWRIDPLTGINFIDPNNPFAGARVSLFISSLTAPIPEPGTLLLLGSGVVGIGAVARRRKSAS